LEILLFAVPLAVPLYVLHEHRWMRRHGIPAATLVSVGIVGGLLACAWALPLKYEDRNELRGLPGNPVTLGDLTKADPRVHVPPGFEGVRLALPVPEPTIRQVLDAVRRQTGMTWIAGRCGNGMSLLGGGYPIFYELVPPPGLAAAPLQATPP
jgi:hypothetical protein